MKMLKTGWTALILALALAWTPHAAAEEPAPAQGPLFQCAQGVEPFLPGDYYLCSGNLMFAKGHIEAAVDRWESSARWGEKRAQYNLGLLYYRGQDVPQDKALGIAWLALAAERPRDVLNRKVLASVLASATPQLRREANALVQAMKPTYADAVARKRALRRFDRHMRDLEWAAKWTPSDTFWIQGMPAMPTSTLVARMNATAESSLDPHNAAPASVTVGTPETVPAAPGSPRP